MTEPLSGPAEIARAGWRAARQLGSAAERIAALPSAEETARAALHAAASEVRLVAPSGDDAARFTAIREKIATTTSSVFSDWMHASAETFHDGAAAETMNGPMAALIEGIKIVDDIQDDEERCLAAEIGPARAFAIALGTLGFALELTSELPLKGTAWRAAATAIGRGLRETAIGQELESDDDAGFDAFWNMVDRKTGPLVATALELGSLAAGADPAAPAALTRLARPLGRILQIGDDCNDALGAHASDWRSPQRNLVLRYTLSGPNAGELTALLRDAANVEALHAAKRLLLRDGALAYAIHAQLVTVADLLEAVDALSLPNPAPFLHIVEQQRLECEGLLTLTGVDPELSRSLFTAPASPNPPSRCPS
ncbi:MAG TPA: polyprenyl synthetase family protein [Thermoanaerobaculia bacterium]|nr:polyprenyl synthetase family protein [Thermoanaerobaculia bacterium]